MPARSRYCFPKGYRRRRRSDVVSFLEDWAQAERNFNHYINVYRNTIAAGGLELPFSQSRHGAVVEPRVGAAQHADAVYVAVGVDHGPQLHFAFDAVVHRGQI